MGSARDWLTPTVACPDLWGQGNYLRNNHGDWVNLNTKLSWRPEMATSRKCDFISQEV